jgi:hypothetical protein
MKLRYGAELPKQLMGWDQMADIFSLRLIGLAFAFVTLAVTATATAAVVANVDADEGHGHDVQSIHVTK